MTLSTFPDQLDETAFAIIRGENLAKAQLVCTGAANAIRRHMMQRLTLPATISKVEERFEQKWKSGFGADAQAETVSKGWYVTIANLSMFVGNDKPDFQEGELIKLAIEKAT